MIVASITVTPWLLTRLPADYFEQEKPHLLERIRRASPAAACLLVCKNVLGISLLLAGIALLFLPGQGLVTIAVGLVLIDFPRKFELERWLVSRGTVLASINWLRTKAHKEPLHVRHEDADA